MVFFEDILSAEDFGAAVDGLAREFRARHELPAIDQLGLVVPNVEEAAHTLQDRGIGPFLIGSGSPLLWSERGEERSVRGRIGLARHLFQKAQALPSRNWMKRALSVRLEGLKDNELASALAAFVARRGKSAVDPLLRLSKKRPRWGLGLYLVGSLFLHMNYPEEAADKLLEALQRKLPHPLIRLEAVWRAGKALFLSQRYKQATDVFGRLDVARHRLTVRLQAREWIERCRWTASNGKAIRKKIVLGPH